MYASENLTLIHDNLPLNFTGNWQGYKSIKTANDGEVSDDYVPVYIFNVSLPVSIGDRICRSTGEEVTVYSIERNISASENTNHILVKGA